MTILLRAPGRRGWHTEPACTFWVSSVPGTYYEPGEPAHCGDPDHCPEHWTAVADAYRRVRCVACGLWFNADDAPDMLAVMFDARAGKIRANVALCDACDSDDPTPFAFLQAAADACAEKGERCAESPAPSLPRRASLRWSIR
jgi:hypothetical protein